jgi:uncharacterized heparinase superfamily protein
LNIFSKFFLKISNQFKNIYFNSNYYDKKISNIQHVNLTYKPSPHLLSSLIKYQTKKINIDDIVIENLWENKNINSKDFNRLNNFYWFFSLDLKSSKKTSQKLILNWIKKNHKYNSKSWEFNLIAKRIIAWLSNHNLTYEESDKEYQKKFNSMIQKQTNHLIHHMEKSDSVDGKIIGCAAIILVGLCYKNIKNYLPYGLSILKRISKSSLDSYGFPKSRNIKQLIFYLKYFVLIREWFREAQVQIPEFIDENIYYLGQGYAFVWQNVGFDILFNGNNISNNSEFDHYLKRFGYKFKNENKEFGGYAILHNTKNSMIMDVGAPPAPKFSKNYQSGALSIEITSNNKKLISNCGYYYSKNSKLKELSKSTANQSTLVIDDNSSCFYKKIDEDNYNIIDGLKITKKNIVYEKNYWKISASHNGYEKKYNSTHDRVIEFYPEQNKFVGTDTILNKNSNFNIKFEIRFHLEPNVKLMKTQNNKSILIDLDDEGWKFTCENFDINIDNGLYFGKKNSYTQNQNILISGIANKKVEKVSWHLTKI